MEMSRSRGFIDPVSLITMAVLLVGLVVSTAIVTNKNFNLNPQKQAATQYCPDGECEAVVVKKPSPSPQPATVNQTQPTTTAPTTKELPCLDPCIADADCGQNEQCYKPASGCPVCQPKPVPAAPAAVEEPAAPPPAANLCLDSCSSDADCGYGNYCYKPATGCPECKQKSSLCTPGYKQCSGNYLQVCNPQGSSWQSQDCGSVGCNSATKACNPAPAPSQTPAPATQVARKPVGAICSSDEECEYGRCFASSSYYQGSTDSTVGFSAAALYGAVPRCQGNITPEDYQSFQAATNKGNLMAGMVALSFVPGVGPVLQFTGAAFNAYNAYYTCSQIDDAAKDPNVSAENLTQLKTQCGLYIAGAITSGIAGGSMAAAGSSTLTAGQQLAFSAVNLADSAVNTAIADQQRQMVCAQNPSSTDCLMAYAYEGLGWGGTLFGAYGSYTAGNRYLNYQVNDLFGDTAAFRLTNVDAPTTSLDEAIVFGNQLDSNPQLEAAYNFAIDNNYPVYIIDESNLATRIDRDTPSSYGSTAQVYGSTINTPKGLTDVAIKLYRNDQDWNPVDVLSEEYSLTQTVRNILNDLAPDIHGVAISPSINRVGLMTDWIHNGELNPSTVQTIQDLQIVQEKLLQAGYYIPDSQFVTTPTGGVKVIDAWGLQELNDPVMIKNLSNEFGLPEAVISADLLYYATISQYSYDAVFSFKQMAINIQKNLIEP